MCDYCDCRELTPIRQLSEEHERISALAMKLRDGLVGGGERAGSATLAELQSALEPHLAREEAGLFAELGARPGFEWYLGQLRDDHARARSGLLGVDPAGEGWAGAVLEALDDLAAHIDLEEYDLFPASRLIIDDAGWAKVIAVHDGMAAGR